MIKKKAHLRNRRKNRARKTSITTAEWIRTWYKEYKEPRHAVTTRQVQTVYIEKHIIPHLGHYQLHELTTQILNKYLKTLNVKEIKVS